MNINKSIRAKNYGGPNTVKRTVQKIILHDTAGSGQLGDVNYLANDPEKRGISVDFAITRDGTIWQLTPNVKTCWTFHAGRNTRIGSAINGRVNQISVGIELVHKAKAHLQLPLWPTPQVQACADLCRWLCEEFNLTPDDITTHAKIVTDGSRSDPREFPFPQFWAMFSQTQVAELTDPVPVTAPLSTYTVVAGDNLWKLAQRWQTTVEALKSVNNMNTASNTIIPGQVLRMR